MVTNNGFLKEKACWSDLKAIHLRERPLCSFPTGSHSDWHFYSSQLWMMRTCEIKRGCQIILFVYLKVKENSAAFRTRWSLSAPTTSHPGQNTDQRLASSAAPASVGVQAIKLFKTHFLLHLNYMVAWLYKSKRHDAFGKCYVRESTLAKINAWQ